MRGSLTLIVVLISAGLVAGDSRIRHLQLNNAHVIETTPNNFAIVAPQLEAQHWKTVSVNGNNLVITAANCQQATRSLDSLSADERQLIMSVRQQLASVDSPAPQSHEQVFRSGAATYSLTGQAVSMSFGRNIPLSTFNSNGFSLTRYDDNNLSIAKPGLPNNIARVFILNQDTVAYVYYDGQVAVRHLQCLQGPELQLVQLLKVEALQSERQFQLNMQQFQQNMANMQLRLQQNLNGMFQQPSQLFQQHQFQRPPMFARPAASGQLGYANSNPMGASFASGGGGAAAAASTAGPFAAPNAAAQAIASGNFPFGPNNSPFYPGFPFGG